MMPTIMVSPKGAARLDAGHPWVFRSDAREDPAVGAGVVAITDHRGKPLGLALHSPHSEIRLRRLAPPGASVDGDWWKTRVREAAQRRSAIRDTGYRVVHGEGDGLPSLIVDRYGDVVVAQLLSAGLEAVRAEVLAAIQEVLRPAGVLLRNDTPVREREKLARETVLLSGEVPKQVDYTEGALRLTALPWTGQKTGAFLDQRENHLLAGSLARGKCLDLFCHHGAFSLQMIQGGAAEATAVDSSATALEALRAAADANGMSGRITTIQADVFEWLTAQRGRERTFDVIALDPPAFAKDRRSVERALAGYRELNLRALRLLAPGGRLLTFSCSYHVHRGDFFGMLAGAAADSGRDVRLERILGASADHPELLTVPETGYLKGAVLSV